MLIAQPCQRERCNREIAREGRNLCSREPISLRLIQRRSFRFSCSLSVRYSLRATMPNNEPYLWIYLSCLEATVKNRHETSAGATHRRDHHRCRKIITKHRRDYELNWNNFIKIESNSSNMLRSALLSGYEIFFKSTRIIFPNLERLKVKDIFKIPNRSRLIESRRI